MHAEDTEPGSIDIDDLGSIGSVSLGSDAGSLGDLEDDLSSFSASPAKRGDALQSPSPAAALTKRRDTGSGCLTSEPSAPHPGARQPFSTSGAGAPLRASALSSRTGSVASAAAASAWHAAASGSEHLLADTPTSSLLAHRRVSGDTTGFVAPAGPSVLAAGADHAPSHSELGAALQFTSTPLPEAHEAAVPASLPDPSPDVFWQGETPASNAAEPAREPIGCNAGSRAGGVSATQAQSSGIAIGTQQDVLGLAPAPVASIEPPASSTQVAQDASWNPPGDDFFGASAAGATPQPAAPTEPADDFWGVAEAAASQDVSQAQHPEAAPAPAMLAAPAGTTGVTGATASDDFFGGSQAAAGGASDKPSLQAQVLPLPQTRCAGTDGEAASSALQPGTDGFERDPPLTVRTSVAAPQEKRTWFDEEKSEDVLDANVEPRPSDEYGYAWPAHDMQPLSQQGAGAGTAAAAVTATAAAQNDPFDNPQASAQQGGDAFSQEAYMEYVQDGYLWDHVAKEWVWVGYEYQPRMFPVDPQAPAPVHEAMQGHEHAGFDWQDGAVANGAHEAAWHGADAGVVDGFAGVQGGVGSAGPEPVNAHAQVDSSAAPPATDPALAAAESWTGQPYPTAAAAHEPLASAETDVLGPMDHQTAPPPRAQGFADVSSAHGAQSSATHAPPVSNTHADRVSSGAAPTLSQPSRPSLDIRSAPTASVDPFADASASDAALPHGPSEAGPQASLHAATAEPAASSPAPAAPTEPAAASWHTESEAMPLSAVPTALISSRSEQASAHSAAAGAAGLPAPEGGVLSDDGDDFWGAPVPVSVQGEAVNLAQAAGPADPFALGSAGRDDPFAAPSHTPQLSTVAPAASHGASAQQQGSAIYNGFGWQNGAQFGVASPNAVFRASAALPQNGATSAALDPARASQPHASLQQSSAALSGPQASQQMPQQAAPRTSLTDAQAASHDPFAPGAVSAQQNASDAHAVSASAVASKPDPVVYPSHATDMLVHPAEHGNENAFGWQPQQQQQEEQQSAAAGQVSGGATEGEPYYYEAWGCWLTWDGRYYYDESSSQWLEVPYQQTSAEDARAQPDNHATQQAPQGDQQAGLHPEQSVDEPYGANIQGPSVSGSGALPVSAFAAAQPAYTVPASAGTSLIPYVAPPAMQPSAQLPQASQPIGSAAGFQWIAGAAVHAPTSCAAPHSVRSALVSSAGRPPRPFVSFAIGGRCVYVRPYNPSSQTYGGMASSGPEAVSVMPVAQLSSALSTSGGASAPAALCKASKKASEAAVPAWLADVESWPGPVTKKGTSALGTVIVARAKACEEGDQANAALLWRTLGLLFKHRGAFWAPPEAAAQANPARSEVLRLLSEGLREDQAPGSDHVAALAAGTSGRVLLETVQGFEARLLKGDKAGALDFALEHKAWPLALVAASALGHDATQRVVLAVAAACLPPASPLRAFAALSTQDQEVYESVFRSAASAAAQHALPGAANAAAMHPGVPQQGPAVFNPAAVAQHSSTAQAQWQRTLLLVASNRGPGEPGLLGALAKSLWDTGSSDRVAAHVCSVVAGAKPGGATDVDALLVLPGADHMRNPGTFASPAAIQLAELYVLALSQAGPTQALQAILAPYYLVYAMHLSEASLMSDAMAYASAAQLLASKADPATTLPFVPRLVADSAALLLDRFKGSADAMGGGAGALPRRASAQSFMSRVGSYVDQSIQKIIGGDVAGDLAALPQPQPGHPSRAVTAGAAFPPLGASASHSSLPDLCNGPGPPTPSQWRQQQHGPPGQPASVPGLWSNGGGYLPDSSGPASGASATAAGGLPPRARTSSLANVASATPGHHRQRSDGQVLNKTPDAEAEAAKDRVLPKKAGRASSGWMKSLKSLIAPGQGKEADLGEENAFFYDEEKKRWRQHGVPDDEQQEAPAGPPPIGLSKRPPGPSAPALATNKTSGPLSTGAASRYAAPPGLAVAAPAPKASPSLSPFPMQPAQPDTRSQGAPPASLPAEFGSPNGSAAPAPAAPLPQSSFPSATPWAPGPAAHAGDAPGSTGPASASNQSNSVLHAPRSGSAAPPSSRLASSPFVAPSSSGHPVKHASQPSSEVPLQHHAAPPTSKLDARQQWGPAAPAHAGPGPPAAQSTLAPSQWQSPSGMPATHYAARRQATTYPSGDQQQSSRSNSAAMPQPVYGMYPSFGAAATSQHVPASGRPPDDNETLTNVPF